MTEKPRQKLKYLENGKKFFQKLSQTWECVFKQKYPYKAIKTKRFLFIITQKFERLMRVHTCAIRDNIM